MESANPQLSTVIDEGKLRRFLASSDGSTPLGRRTRHHSEGVPRPPVALDLPDFSIEVALHPAIPGDHKCQPPSDRIGLPAWDRPVSRLRERKMKL
jgi:hypothetical protein